MRLTSGAMFIALLFPTAIAYSAPPAPSAPPAHMRGGLTPEERFVYMKQMHGPDWRKLSIAQRCERAQQIRHERKSMSAADRQKLRLKLDAEWNKLPAAEKQRIEQRIAAHRARREEGKPHAHGRRCTGVNPEDSPGNL
ncbi:MAG: hypothetical protein ACJ8EL_00955 [Rhizomicrobium sp.]